METIDNFNLEKVVYFYVSMCLIHKSLDNFFILIFLSSALRTLVSISQFQRRSYSDKSYLKDHIIIKIVLTCALALRAYVNDSTITNLLGMDYCNLCRINLISFELVFLGLRSICGNVEFCKLLLIHLKYSQTLQTFENTVIRSYKSFYG